ncbi:MAG: peptidoglycan-binding domain-containing protein [Deltaproteobacteria bacterium]
MSNETIRPNLPRPIIQMKPVVCCAKDGHVDCTVPAEPASPWKAAPAADAVLDGRSAQRRGQYGGAVRRLQSDLERHAPGDTPLAKDGYYGPKTEARVRAFQAEHGLQVDGIVGDETQAKLDELTMRDILLDERFTRLPETTQRAILALDANATPETRRHLIAMITSETFAELPTEAQANLLEWRPIEARVAIGV